MDISFFLLEIMITHGARSYFSVNNCHRQDHWQHTSFCFSLFSNLVCQAKSPLGVVSSMSVMCHQPFCYIDFYSAPKNFFCALFTVWLCTSVKWPDRVLAESGEHVTLEWQGQHQSRTCLFKYGNINYLFAQWTSHRANVRWFRKMYLLFIIRNRLRLEK